MDINDFLNHLNAGNPVEPGTEFAQMQNQLAAEAIELCMQFNSTASVEGRMDLLERLTCRPLPEGLRVFPPFTTDCGKNTHLGTNVFINSGCRFQDQGGITIGDGALIGHNVVIATLNHSMDPESRATTIPAPVHIGAGVWIGANATITPGVRIGENAVVAAGAVVSKDVEPNTVVGGVPARKIKDIG